MAEAPERLRRAATVLSYRSQSIVLVLERSADSDYEACLRTAEALGVQDVWIVGSDPAEMHEECAISRTAKGAHSWLSLRNFTSVTGVHAALREQGCTVWAVDDTPGAIALDDSGWGELSVNHESTRIAVMVPAVDATAADSSLVHGADRRVFIPSCGFTTRRTASVTTGLVLQKLLDWMPHARGNLSEARAADVWKSWCEHIGESNPTARRKADEWRDRRQQVAPSPRLPHGCSSCAMVIGVGQVETMSDLRRSQTGSSIPPKVQRNERLARAGQSYVPLFFRWLSAALQLPRRVKPTQTDDRPAEVQSQAADALNLEGLSVQLRADRELASRRTHPHAYTNASIFLDDRSWLR